MPTRLQAPCKINLYLDVLGRRADGYHEIVTVFLPLPAPSDDVEVRPAEPGRLRVVCPHRGVPEGPGNLCWRAAAEFAREAGLEPGWEIVVSKRIPVAAGLGGGSSDAAAVLRLLAQLVPGVLNGDRLRSVAARLGADVAFFLDPRPALGRGIGEVLTPVACGGPLDVVLVNPGFPVSAAWAYAHRGRVPVPPAPPVEGLLGALARGSVEDIARLAYNALEHAVLDKFPLLRMLQASLVEQGCLCAHVSGSGPTVYGICPEGAAAAAADALRRQYGETVWVCVTRAAPGATDSVPATV